MAVTDTRTVKELRRDWRKPKADALRQASEAIEETVTLLADLADLFGYDDDNTTATEIRTMMGILRTRASDRRNEAERLEAAAADAA